MRGDKTKIVGGYVDVELDRRREAAVERGHRRLVDAAEYERLGRPGQGEHAALDRASVGKRERQVAPVAADETDGERDHHRLLARLARRRRHGLRDVEAIGPRARVVAA